MKEQSTPKTSLWMKRLAYGSGDTSCNIVVGMVSATLVLFYTDYVGINPGIIGTVMLLSKILDGLVSFTMGILSEKQSPNTENTVPGCYLAVYRMPFPFC